MKLSPVQSQILREHLRGPRPFIARKSTPVRILARERLVRFGKLKRATVLTERGRWLLAEQALSQ